MSEEYERYSLDIAKYILIALQILGGNASRQEIKEKFVEDTQFDLTYHEVFEPYTGKTYSHFLFDFNFGLIALKCCNYIEPYKRNSNIILTQKGKNFNAQLYPTDEDKEIQQDYWQKAHNKKSNEQAFINWCTNHKQLKNSNKLYSESSAKDFTFMLKKQLCKKIPEIQKEINSQNIFIITDYELIDAILNKYLSEIDNIDKLANNADGKNSLILYSEFLKGNNCENPIEQLETYNKGDNMESAKYHPLNQILYGPPGTGKTYNTVIKAIEITNPELIQKDKDGNVENYEVLKEKFDELKQQGQIEFVTFHQSYSYEEFVEGIKPDLENGKELRYKLQNGIFKTICNNAKELLETKVKYNFNKDNISVYKILIPDESLFAYCIENDCVAINWGNDIDISNCDSQEEIIAKIPEDFESRKQCISQLNLFKLWIDNDLKSGKDVIVVIPGSMNTIKGIAKITGDYFYNSDIENGHQQRKVDWIRKNINISSDNIYNSKFVSPTITGMFNDKINWDTFLNLINNKNNSKSSNAVLVIDEINRGDISKIFGELITLIEEDKRIGKEHQMTVTLPYSRETFGVPNNLYIIGTMNTADRSIALLDTALRRRFDFEEMMPKPELLRGKDIEGVDLEQLLTKINDRIKNEYDRDHQIGHSYLMGVKNKEQLERAYKNRILPLLNEYFYNDIDSVAKILNCKPNDISSKENWFNVLKEAQKPTKKENEQ